MVFQTPHATQTTAYPIFYKLMDGFHAKPWDLSYFHFYKSAGRIISPLDSQGVPLLTSESSSFSKGQGWPRTPSGFSKSSLTPTEVRWAATPMEASVSIRVRHLEAIQVPL